MGNLSDYCVEPVSAMKWLILLSLLSVAIAIRYNFVSPVRLGSARSDEWVTAAVLPGSPLVTGTIAQGISNGFSLYSNVLLAR